MAHIHIRNPEHFSKVAIQIFERFEPLLTAAGVNHSTVRGDICEVYNKRGDTAQLQKFCLDGVEDLKIRNEWMAYMYAVQYAADSLEVKFY